MKIKALYTIVVLVVATILVAGAMGGLVQAEPVPGAPAAPKDVVAVVSSDINYQGRLTDPDGTPLDGTYPMRFQLYDLASGGTLLWDSGVFNVPVSDGLFSVPLAVSAEDFDGQELWLRLYVGGEWLTPRQEILPAPYALGLRPGATVQGEPSSWSGHLVRVEMTGTYPSATALLSQTATGTAVRGDSTGGYGLYGYTNDGYAVFGADYGNSSGQGYGGYFYSANGVPVYGSSGAQSYYTNMWAPGVYGRSSYGAGVYGASNGTEWSAYGGVFEGRSGVLGRSTGTSSTTDYGGQFIGTSRRGLYAISVNGYYDGYFGGTGGVYAAGYWSLRGMQTLAVNVGPEPLAPGDVVALAGVTSGPDGQTPMLQVTLATTDNAAAVAGVVVQGAEVTMVVHPEQDGVELPDVSPAEGEVAAGGYLFLATDGLVTGVKTDQNLSIGDLVTVGPQPGQVMKSLDAVPGTILGKVAGPVDPEHGTVPVLLILR